MRYRPLGRTGLDVSVVGLGASPLGGVFGAIDEDEGIRCVRRALELGVNFIDVAPYYGLTRAEAVLGKALQGVPRDAYYLSTKVGRYAEADFDFSAERITRSVDESRQRLGVDHVDLILCHDIEFGDLRQVIDETLPALERVRASGKARFIGVSGLPIRIFREVLSHARLDVILSYCRYNLANTALQELLPLLQEQGVGVISASPLAMGLLTRNGPPEWHPASTELKDACRRAALLCQERGTDIARLALQFAVARPEIACTLVGSARAEEMERNARWIEDEADPELLAEVRAVLAGVGDRIWPTGRPENQDERSER